MASKRSREPTPAKKSLKKSKPAEDEEEVKVEPARGGSFPSYDGWIAQMHSSWQGALQPWLDRGNLQRIYNWVSDEYRNFPCRPVADEIFTAFRLTPFDQVKVVIVGQDPYPGPTEAMGLSFSGSDKFLRYFLSFSFFCGISWDIFCFISCNRKFYSYH